ncbi:MAG: hypothetical protein ACI4DN_04855, partial [Lachnospiraceae bacterium]
MRMKRILTILLSLSLVLGNTVGVQAEENSSVSENSMEVLEETVDSQEEIQKEEEEEEQEEEQEEVTEAFESVSDNTPALEEESSISENSVSSNEIDFLSVQAEQADRAAEAEWIILKEAEEDGTLRQLQGFISWSDALSYLNTLSHSNGEYIVEISRDWEMKEALTLPSGVKKITFKGVTESRIVLTYLGDLKLQSDTAFENIELKAIKFNSGMEEEYHSLLTVNGKKLSLMNVMATFSAVTGSAAATIELLDSAMDVDKAVSDLGCLVMDKARLRAESLTVTDRLTMSSSEIDCQGKIVLKDVVSEDSGNSLSYGGNSSGNILTLSGTVSSRDEGDETVGVIRVENGERIGKEAVIRKNAITLKVKAVEAGQGYQKGVLLANIPKAGSGWFVLGSDFSETQGSEENRTVRTISYAAYKKDNALYCGEIGENVRLYSSSGKEGDYAYNSSFTTLQEALLEIDKQGKKENHYLIELLDAQENTATFSNMSLTFPTKAAEIRITGSKSLTEVNLYFKGNLTLKGNLVFEDITFIPAAASIINLGGYSLTLIDCKVEGKTAAAAFTGIKGTGVTGPSRLILKDTDLAVRGAVQNIGELNLSGERYSSLSADGAVSLGNVVLEAEGKITGAATVSRKNGDITKIVPQITINGEVSSPSEKVLSLDLQEKVGSIWKQLDFDADEMDKLRDIGVPMAKAVQVTYGNIVAEQSADVKLIKSGGYLTFVNGGPGVTLSFTEKDTLKTISCPSFADAVTEINNRKTKQDYRITLHGTVTETSAKNLKALTMPNKNYVQSLTIESDSSEDTETIFLHYMGNITQTCNVQLKDVHFVQWIKVGSTYQAAHLAKGDCPSAVTWNTGGFQLELEGNNTFNTPLNLKGGTKGSLVFHGNGRLNTRTNHYVEDRGKTDSTIFGMLTAFASVEIRDCTLTLKEYCSSPGATKYIASNNQMSSLSVTEGSFKVTGDNAKASLKATALLVDNGEVLVGGKVNLGNLSLKGEQKAKILADLDFNITGTLTSLTDNATLITRLKGSGKAPYLNVSGTVVRGAGIYPIYVGVYPEITASAQIRQEAVTLKDAPKPTGQLLTAKKAMAGDFRPIAANYSGGEYSTENTSGYMMFKSGSSIYVYEGGKSKLAVYRNGQLMGYYPSVKEATAAVNALKDKTAEYTYLLTGQNGTALEPIQLTLPSQAAKLTIRPSEGYLRGIYFTGNLSLGCDIVMEKISFFPVSKGKGAAFNITTNGYDLELKDSSVGAALSGMRLNSIVGKGNSEVTLSSEALQITGSLTGVKTLRVSENLTVKGSLKAGTLVLSNSQAGKAVTLRGEGSIVLNDVEHRGSGQNTIQYTRTAKNITNLTINQQVKNTGSAVLLLEQITTNLVSSSNDYTLSNEAVAGTRVILAAKKRLFNLPRASTDSFEVMVTDSSLTQDAQSGSIRLQKEGVVKADKGVFYIGNISGAENVLAAHRVVLSDGTTSTNCLDYTQAINEINSRNKLEAEYILKFSNAGKGVGVPDTNLTDSYLYSSLPQPKANTKTGLTISGEADSSVTLTFTGAISAYGSLTLENLVLNPVKSGKDGTAADTKITLSGDKASSKLYLKGVGTQADSNGASGWISSISGVKNKTSITTEGCKQLLIKGGISNVDQLRLKSSSLLTKGNSAVNTIFLEEGGNWCSMGGLTVQTIQVLSDAETTWLGTQQDKNGNSRLTVKGMVEKGILLCRQYQYGAALPIEISSYKDVSLAIAPKANAASFRAYPYREQLLKEGTAADGVNRNNLIAYKEGNYIKNGRLD